MKINVGDIVKCPAQSRDLYEPGIGIVTVAAHNYVYLDWILPPNSPHQDRYDHPEGDFIAKTDELEILIICPAIVGHCVNKVLP
jgi:hypothetical protein